MPTPKQQRRRALELLVGSLDGCTEAIMLAHGFKIEFLVDLINARLATAQTERMVAGGRWVEVIRFRITEAGSGHSRIFDGPDSQTRVGLSPVRRMSALAPTTRL
jgi:hypothetical protein